MANRERGEVNIDVNGKAYTFKPTFNAICAISDLIGKELDEITAAAEKGRVWAIRALVWTYLQAYHADEIKTLEDAGRWMDEAGLPAITAQLAAANRENAGPRGKGTNKRPQTAQIDGTTSTLKVVESA